MKLTITLAACLVSSLAYAEGPLPAPSPTPPVAVTPPAETSNVERPTGYVSGLLGTGLVTTSVPTGGSKSFFGFGGRAGVDVRKNPSGSLAVGVSVTTMSDSAKISGVTIDARSTMILGELLLRNAWNSPFYFGSRWGVAISSASATNGTTSLNGSGTAFSFAPVVGVEVPLAPHLALTLDLAWVYRGSGNLTLGTTKISYDSSQLLFALGGLTVNF